MFQTNFMKFIEYQKKRTTIGEIYANTIGNQQKATKLFCKIDNLIINQNSFQNLPLGRKATNIRAPTIEEIQKILSVI